MGKWRGEHYFVQSSMPFCQLKNGNYVNLFCFKRIEKWFQVQRIGYVRTNFSYYNHRLRCKAEGTVRL